MADGCHYSIIFKLEDGEHTASMFKAHRHDKEAMEQAKRTFGDSLVSLKFMSKEEHDKKVVVENLAKYPSRTPLDELTNGQMNQVVSNPDLAQPE